MAYIESAFLGDEKAMRNVTKVLGSKILGTSIDVDVNEKLIPPLTVADKTELTAAEERKIREAASKQCNGNDQECITAKEAQLRQEVLAAKERQGNSSANVIKGRRLTVNIIDENGKRRRVIIPDGQKFKMDNISISDPRKPMQLPTMEYVQNQFKLLGSLSLSTFVYVFSIVLTFTVFSSVMGTPLFAIPLVVIAVFIPFSGYIMVFLYYMFTAFVATYVGEPIQLPFENLKNILNG